MRSALGVESRRSARGSITAEFIVALPAILLVLAALLQATQLLHQQYSLTVLTQQTSRLWLFEGESAARSMLATQHPDIRLHSETTAGMLCVKTTRMVPLFGVSTVPIGARSCVAQ